MKQYGLEWPEEAPNYAAAAGSLMAAWFVWNGVRWVNQRDRGKKPLQNGDGK